MNDIRVGATEIFLGNIGWYCSFPIDRGMVVIGSSPWSEPDPRSNDTSEAGWTPFPWVVPLGRSIKSISISCLYSCVGGDGFSQGWGGGGRVQRRSRDNGGMIDEYGGIYSTIGDVDIDCLISLVRLTM